MEIEKRNLGSLLALYPKTDDGRRRRGRGQR